MASISTKDQFHQRWKLDLRNSHQIPSSEGAHSEMDQLQKCLPIRIHLEEKCLIFHGEKQTCETPRTSKERVSTSFGVNRRKSCKAYSFSRGPETGTFLERCCRNHVLQALSNSSNFASLMKLIRNARSCHDLSIYRQPLTLASYKDQPWNAETSLLLNLQ